MTEPIATPFLLDVYEEHLNEAAWLWREWEACLDSPVYTLSATAKGPEERLLAHLDGLVLGGEPVAQALLIPALAGEERFAIAAAAWALVQAEDADHQDAVFAAFSGAAAPPVRAAFARALFLSPRLDLSRLVPLWNDGAPELQALVMDLFAPREPGWVRERLEPALRSGQVPLVASALRAIRRSRDNAFFNYVQVALQSPEPEILTAAIGAGLVLGVRETWDACRAGSELKGSLCRLPLGVLATSHDPKDRERVRKKTADPDAALHAVWALGFTGDLESVDLLLQRLSDENLAKVACESLGFIAGLVCENDLAKNGETNGPEEVEVADDVSPPVVSHADFLPEPQPDAIRKWWERESRRFRAGTRYIRGEVRSPDALRRALFKAATWRQEVLLLELTTTKIGAPPMSVGSWAREQQKVLGVDDLPA
jgi:uncharacterized protein (TIGR02270 family)